MGLGLPLALLGLLGVGIPLWIHRVRKRTLRELALPTIALLERAVAKRRRTLTFRDRPLLYARIALAVLFALALARPYLSRVASYATERPIALAVLIDDSMSMQRKGTHESLFEGARTRAERVLNELAPESEVAIILGGNEPRTLVARTNDVPLALRALGQLEALGARGTALSQALALGLRELGGSRLSAKEVLVLTDCASHAGADTLESQAAHLRVECLEAKDARGNPYIAGMTLSEGRELDDPSLLTVVLGGPEREDVELVVTLDGKAIGQQGASIEHGSGSVEFSLDGRALRRGRVLGARIETDNALPLDDQRELSLDDVAALSVLLVDGDPAPNQLDDELRFISLALNLDDGQHGAPRVTRIDADGLSAIDLNGFDVVVLANVRAPSELEAERLVDHVARGGGLLIAAGENFDAFGYRGRLSALLPALPRSSAPVSPALGVAAGAASELVPSGGAGLETARTTKRVLLEAPNEDSKALLTLSDGTPLVVAGRHGRGRVALLATTIDDDWSDLPLTPGFLPLVHGLVRGLAAVDALPRGPHPAGSVLSARVPLGARALYLMTPDGRRIDLALDKPTLRITDTAVPGVYRTLAALDQRSERELTQLSFTIVPDTRDSDLTVRRPMPQRERVATAGAGRPRGVESWFWFGFGLLILSEGYVRVLLARRREASLVDAQG
ncbi:MAG TPA: VWA domain-containing protein [Polyangiales bacterium]|nr:VWA domain-containing protein [Polyangiales bacterium]